MIKKKEWKIREKNERYGKMENVKEKIQRNWRD